MDRQMAAVAVATALSVGDATGYAVALKNLPPFDAYIGDNDFDADEAIFSGSGVAS